MYIYMYVYLLSLPPYYQPAASFDSPASQPLSTTPSN